MNHVEIRRKQIQLCSLSLYLVVIWILGKTIGDNGVAYLAVALEGFAFIWAIIGAGVPDTLGKLLRGRYAKGQYKNASKLKRSILIFQGFVGIIGSVLFMAISQFLAETLFRVSYSRFLIMLLSPVIFFRAINGVLTGVFQGEGSELPAVVTCFLRPALILGFGLLFSNILVIYGKKVSSLLQQDEFKAMYGGVGVVLAILLTEILITLFFILVCKGNGKKNKKKDDSGMRTTDSFGRQIFVLYRNMSISILFSLLLLFPFVLGVIFLQKSATNIYATANAYGLYIGKYLVLCGVCIALMDVIILPTAAKVVSMIRKDEHRTAVNTFQSGMKTGITGALFWVMLLSVMSKQFAAVLSSNAVDTLAQMYLRGTGIIIFGVGAYYCFILLKLLGEKYRILVSLVIADIFFAGILRFLLENNKGDIMALVYAGLIYAVALAVALCVMTCILLKTGIDWPRILVVPIGSACVSGLIGYFLGKVLMPHLGNFMTLLIIWALTGLLYWGIVLFLRCFSEQELSMIPGGRMLAALARLLGVF